jgi:methionyl-tRNA formyltransferase
VFPVRDFARQADGDRQPYCLPGSGHPPESATRFQGTPPPWAIIRRMRLVFMGTPDLARVSLEALLATPDFSVPAVVTQPDRPKGRDMKLQPSPVKELAVARGIPVLQPDRARDPALAEQLRSFGPEIIAVAAYGQILPREILVLPRLGCVNVHTSLLPRYRGASPIQAALLNGDPETGVTIMQMDEGMDTGAILRQETTPISPEDTAATLHDRLALLGAGLLVRTIREYAEGRIQPKPQPLEGVSLAPKIRKGDGHIRWNQPAVAIWNRVRAFTPWPGAFTFTSAGEARQLLKVWRGEVVASSAGPPGRILASDKSGILVACGQDALRILVLQREGGKRLDAQDFLSGHPLKPGTELE